VKRSGLRRCGKLHSSADGRSESVALRIATRGRGLASARAVQLLYAK